MPYWDPNLNLLKFDFWLLWLAQRPCVSLVSIPISFLFPFYTSLQQQKNRNKSVELGQEAATWLRTSHVKSTLAHNTARVAIENLGKSAPFSCWLSFFVAVAFILTSRNLDCYTPPPPPSFRWICVSSSCKEKENKLGLFEWRTAAPKFLPVFYPPPFFFSKLHGR